MEVRWADKKIRLAGRAVLVLFFLFLATGPLLNTDLWMHLAIGRTLWESRSIPATDLFCYPTLGHPYIYFEWLYQVGLYLAYRAMGAYSFEVIKYLLWAGILLFTYLTMRELTRRRWGAIIVLFFVACWLRIRVGTAPDTFSFLFFSLYVYILVLYLHRGKNRLWLLPLLQILWINIHLSAILGLLLVGWAWLDQFWRRYFTGDRLKAGQVLPPGKSPRLKLLSFILGAVILASLVTPYFHKILTFISFYFQHQSAIKTWIIDWYPIQKFLFVRPYLLAAVILLGAIILGRKFLRPFYLLCALSFFLLPFYSGRFFPYFVLGALPLVVLGFSSLNLEGWKSFKTIPKRALIGMVILLTLLGANIVWLQRFQSPPRLTFGYAEFLLPRGAVAFMEQAALPGRLLNHMDFAGYIQWRLYPRVMPFIDGRIANPALFEGYMFMMQNPGVAEELLNRYGINYIVTKSCVLADGKIWPLVEHLYQNPRWALIYADENSLIFLRNHPANQAWLDKYRLPKEKIYQEIASEAEGYGKLWHRGAGYWDRTLAYAYLKLGKNEEAKKALGRWVKDHPEDKVTADILRSFEKTP